MMCGGSYYLFLCIAVLVIPRTYCVTSKLECLPGEFHRLFAAPGNSTFSECSSWRDLSCCTTEVISEIKHHQVVSLYGDRWDRCGPLSAECQKYYTNEECFYQCDPYLAPYLIPGSGGVIRGVPVCASYCDDWFAACQEDLICVENILEDYDWSTGTNQCPENSRCVTFSEMYGDGETLCNSMYGDAFQYSSSDQSQNSFCMVMEFNNHKANPNNPNHDKWMSTYNRLQNWLSSFIF